MSKMRSGADVKRMLREIRDAMLSYARKKMPEYANRIVLERKKGFDESRGPDGSKWPPLDPKTIMRKMGKHSTTRIRKGEVYKGKVKSYGSRLSSALNKNTSTESIAPASPLIDTGALRTPTIEITRNGAIIRLARSRSYNVGSGQSISSIHDKGIGQKRRHHWGIYPAAQAYIEKDFYDKLDAEKARVAARYR